MKRPWFVLMALVAALLIAGCGDSDDDGDSARQAAEEREESSSPTEAIAEIGEVERSLDKGLEQYEAGDAKEAERTVGDAYLEHFELVEGPLEERDPELMESLEVTISTEIRDKIKQGAPVAEVRRLVAKAQEGLEDARKTLESGS